MTASASSRSPYSACVRRQFIGADGDIAPLEAFADIPDLAAAGAPGGEVGELPPGFGQKLAADPLVGAQAVAVHAGEIELADFACHQGVAAPDRCNRIFRAGIHLDRRAVGKVSQINRQVDVVRALHQQIVAGGAAGMAGDEFLDTDDFFQASLVAGHAGGPGPEALFRGGMARGAGFSAGAGARIDRSGAFHRSHAVVDEGIQIVARFDRNRAGGGILQRILEHTGFLERFQEGHDVLDFLRAEKMVGAPGRHHGVRIDAARVIHIIEQPLVGSSPGAEGGQIGADAAGQGGRGLAHDVARHATAAARAIECQFFAVFGVARDWVERIRAGQCGRRRIGGRCGLSQRVVVFPVGGRPVAVAQPGRGGCGLRQLQRHRRWFFRLGSAVRWKRRQHSAEQGEQCNACGLGGGDFHQDALLGWIGRIAIQYS